MLDAIKILVNWMFPPVIHRKKVLGKYEPGNYFGS